MSWVSKRKKGVAPISRYLPCCLLNSEGKNGVEDVAAILVAKVHISDSIASIPGVHRVVITYWAAIDAAQSVIETVEATGVVGVVPESEFYIVEVVVTVKLEHYIIPSVVHKLHVGEVYNTVLKTINVVAVVVEVVQGIAERSSPSEAKHSSDCGVARVAANIHCHNGTIYPHCGWTPLTYRGTDGIGPTPAVVTEAVEEAIAIEARTVCVVVTEAVVVNAGTTACHYAATHFGARIVGSRTAGGRRSVSIAIVAAGVWTNVATVTTIVTTVTSIVATSVGANCAATIVTAVTSSIATSVGTYCTTTITIGGAIVVGAAVADASAHARAVANLWTTSSGS